LLFFNLVAIITTLLCFFILWLSFSANVRENVWEYGVLRSLGLTANEITRIYIYEAMALIITSILLGAATGLLVSYTLSLQFNLFSELNTQFEFPWLLFGSVFAMSVFAAFMGSYLATRKYAHQEISSVIRGAA